MLSSYDLSWCVHCLPLAVKDAMRERPGRLFVAGGYIRSKITGEPVNDVDLFVPERADAQAIAEKIGGPVYTTENALTLTATRPVVQIIHRWTFATPQQCVESFDFTIASAAIWYDGSRWQSVCHPNFYADLAARRLVYLSPAREEEPGGSMLRVLKFYQRGYRIPLDSLGAVVARLVGKVRTSHLTEEGEEGLARVITGLLREVDPLVDPTHSAHLPSMRDESP